MLFGKRLEVNYSKHPQINPSADTQDYSSSNLNRFNRNVSKNYRYCCAPTKMIHVSSLPGDATETKITAYLAPHGNILEAKIFEANGKKQALIHFENEEKSCLIICHPWKKGKYGHLICSISRFYNPPGFLEIYIFVARADVYHFGFVFAIYHTVLDHKLLLF